VIEFKGVTKWFGSKNVLDGIDLQIRNAEIVFVLGRSGVGKSVLLKHLVGLLRPDRGSIRVDDKEITGLTEAALFPIRKLCGMVFQFPALLDSLSVYENVAFGLRSLRLCETEAAVRATVLEKLSLVNLGEELLPRFPTELSYGMQKRVSIARTLAVQPSYLLFDEPTTGLDPVATARIDDLIRRLSRKLNVTSLVVSHDILSALKIADRIVLLDKGRVVVEGTPADVEKSEHPLARDFLMDVRDA
jgi:phospholipid/cholesterol/gamma-HCH transport system ATP-binding protein